MRYRLESLCRLGADALGWRIGCNEILVGGFQLLKLAVQGVVFRIADGGPVFHVITPLMLPDDVAQGGQAFLYGRLFFHVPFLNSLALWERVG